MADSAPLSDFDTSLDGSPSCARLNSSTASVLLSPFIQNGRHSDGPKKTILKDVVAYVEARSGRDNRSAAVSYQLRQLGAVVADRLTGGAAGTLDVTHVVFKGGRKSTRERALRRGLYLVSVLWVESCKEKQEHVPETSFLIGAPDKPVTPMIGRLKKCRSMQPKDFEEEVAKSGDRGVRRRQRRAMVDKWRVVDTPALPFYVHETQSTSPTLESPSFNILIPETPPSMRRRINSLKKENDSESTATPVSHEDSDPLQRRLFNVGEEKDATIASTSPTVHSTSTSSHNPLPSTSPPQQDECNLTISNPSVKRTRRLLPLHQSPRMELVEPIQSNKLARLSVFPEPRRRCASTKKRAAAALINQTVPLDDVRRPAEKRARRCSDADVDYDGDWSIKVEDCGIGGRGEKLREFLNYRLQGKDTGKGSAASKTAGVSNVCDRVNSKAVSSVSANTMLNHASIITDVSRCNVNSNMTTSSSVVTPTDVANTTNGISSNLGAARTHKISSPLNTTPCVPTVITPKPDTPRRLSTTSKVTSVKKTRRSSIDNTRLSSIGEDVTMSSSEQNATTVSEELSDRSVVTTAVKRRSSVGKRRSNVRISDTSLSPVHEETDCNAREPVKVVSPCEKSLVTVRRKSSVRRRRSINPVVSPPTDAGINLQDPVTPVKEEEEEKIPAELSVIENRLLTRLLPPATFLSPIIEEATLDCTASFASPALNSARRRRSTVCNGYVNMTPGRSSINRRTIELSSPSLANCPVVTTPVATKRSRSTEKAEVRESCNRSSPDISDYTNASMAGTKLRDANTVSPLTIAEPITTQSMLESHTEKVVSTNCRRRSSRILTPVSTPSCPADKTPKSSARWSVDKTPKPPPKQSIDTTTPKPSTSRSVNKTPKVGCSIETSPESSHSLSVIKTPKAPTSQTSDATLKGSAKPSKDRAPRVSTSRSIDKPSIINRFMDTTPNRSLVINPSRRSIDDFALTHHRPAPSAGCRGWKKVEIAAADTSQNSAQKQTLVMTSLHFDQQDIVRSVVRRLGGYRVADKVDARTTHVVCGNDRRTLNVLHAIGRGCWLLSMEWVLKSLESNRWLEEELFEQRDFFPAAQMSRLEKFSAGCDGYNQDLFSQQGAIYVADNTMPNHAELTKLLTLCGGKGSPQRIHIVPHEDLAQFLCRMPFLTQPSPFTRAWGPALSMHWLVHLNGWVEVTSCLRKATICVGKAKSTVKRISEQWVLDSIISHRCLPCTNYELDNSGDVTNNESSPEF